jgi:putative glutamine amidotransferase
MGQSRRGDAAAAIGAGRDSLKFQALHNLEPQRAWTRQGAQETVGAEMSKPVVGVIGNAHLVDNVYRGQLVGMRSLNALAQVAGALPLMFAGAPDITEVDALLGVADGVLLTGGRANVHPSHYGIEPDARHEPFDPERDAMALGLVRACVDRGVPLLGICRGLQEINVAFGGSLHPEIRDLPGRMNHRAPRLENGKVHPDPQVVFADRHEVRLTPEGAFAKLFGCATIRVNSLHGQGILEPGERIVVEGVAEDGTIEAIRVADAPAFALGVQWHAEYDAATNPINRALFRAFGAALLDRKRTS